MHDMSENSTMATDWFGPRLKAIREKAGFTQQKLANDAGVSLAAVQRYEGGRGEPGFDILLAIAKVLGVSLSAFDPPADEAEPEKPAKRKPRRKAD